jgi:hypothetical protein
MTFVGKSAGNSAEFCNYSDSGPFELRNFHRNVIIPIVKCVPANLEHVPAGLESSPTIHFSVFMNRKTFLPFIFCPPLSHLLVLSRCRDGGNHFLSRCRYGGNHFE